MLEVFIQRERATSTQQTKELVDPRAGKAAVAKKEVLISP
jgi:hypothetical protein